MFINTHLLIGKSLYENIDKKKSFFINEKDFIYGNIKPDLPSKYYLMKHYLDESLDMIIHKINYLCTLSLESLSNCIINSPPILHPSSQVKRLSRPAIPVCCWGDVSPAQICPWQRRPLPLLLPLISEAEKTD